MSEKLLTLRELRIALVGPGCPFNTPPAPRTVRGWTERGLTFHLLPGGAQKRYLLSEVLAFLKKHTEVVG